MGRNCPTWHQKRTPAARFWADTAYRSKANEKHLIDNRLVSRIHRKKPKGKPMSASVARANGAKSKVRSAVEHVFARQKGPMGLVVRTIGIARATVKIGLANIVYNMKRAIWLTYRLAAAGIPAARPSRPEQQRSDQAIATQHRCPTTDFATTPVIGGLQSAERGHHHELF